MATLLRAYSNRLGKRRSVPQGRLRLDRTHPLTQGLIGCWVPGAMGTIDLTRNLDLTLRASTAWAVGLEGPGNSATAVSTAMFSDTVPASYVVGTSGSAYSLYTRCHILGASTNNCRVIGIDLDNTLGPVDFFNIESNGVQTTSGCKIAYNAAGTATSTASFSTAVAAGGLMSIGATIVCGGNVVGYQDGKQSLSVAGPATIANTPLPQRFGFNGTGSDNTDFVNATMFIGCLWNRALSGSEMNLIHNDPYGFLLPAEREMPIGTDVLAAQISM